MNGAPAAPVRQDLAALLGLLRCPACMGELRLDRAASPAVGATLHCGDCRGEFPVRSGIPRFVEQPADALAQRTQASFGYEWLHFDDWAPSGETNFADYFAGLDLASLREATVLDAGCGMGRHARQLAPHVQRLVAVDFSQAIEAAARNVADRPNVACIQADLNRLPVADSAFDFVYSMGVVHHLENTEAAVQALARKLRPGGRLRLYLYWKRPGVAGLLLRTVSLARRVTTRLPFPLLRTLSWLLSVGLYGVVVLPYRALIATGYSAPARWPLGVYTKYPFTVLYNDQFDRFSAPLEKRYSEAEARALLESAGLRGVQVQPRFGWLVDGIR